MINKISTLLSMCSVLSRGIVIVIYTEVLDSVVRLLLLNL